MDGGSQFSQEWLGRTINNGVEGDKLQGIDMKFLYPIDGIIDKIFPDLISISLVKINGLAPGRQVGQQHDR